MRRVEHIPLTNPEHYTEAVQNFLQEAQKDYRARLVDFGEWILSPLKGTPWGLKVKDGGGVSRSYARNYRATTSLVVLAWVYPHAVIAFDRPDLDRRGDLPSWAEGELKKEVLARLREITTENGVPWPHKVVRKGTFAFEGPAMGKECDTLKVHLGEDIVALPLTLPWEALSYTFPTLAKKLHEAFGGPPSLWRKALEGDEEAALALTLALGLGNVG